MSTTESLLLRAIALHTQEEIAMQTRLSTSQVQRISTDGRAADAGIEVIGDSRGDKGGKPKREKPDLREQIGL